MDNGALTKILYNISLKFPNLPESNRFNLSSTSCKKTKCVFNQRRVSRSLKPTFLCSLYLLMFPTMLSSLRINEFLICKKKYVKDCYNLFSVQLFQMSGYAQPYKKLRHIYLFIFYSRALLG